MNVEIRNEAHLDIAEGVAFYDRQAYGAGDYFYQKIFEDIDSPRETAGIHEIHLVYHRKIASRLPLLIYYRRVTPGVEVAADLDGRSRPTNIEAMLRRR